MADERLVNLRTRLEMGTVEFEDSMTKVKRELRTMRNEVKLSAAETNLFGKNSRTLGEEMKSLDKFASTLTVAIKQQTAEYEKLRNENTKLNGEGAKSTKQMDNAANKINRLSRELAQTEAKMKALNLEIAKQDSSLYQWSQKLQSGGKTLEKVGKGMNSVANEWMKLSGALALGAGILIKTAIDWETAWTSTLKTVEGTPAQLAALQTGLRELSKEIPVSANELAELASVAGQLGIETDKVLEFTEVVAALGATTNMSAETAAEEFARLANITGMSQDEFDNLGSSVVELGNNLATSEAEISTMAMRLAAAGSQIGLSEADIVGLAGALSSLGIEAEAGGSAISKLMINMSVSAATGLDQMVALEQTTGYTRREMELMASNNSKDFKALADSIGMTTSEMTEVMTASKNLENFAEIAGMSGEEFQKAFGADAIGTMQKFIDGLAGIDTESASAVEKLDAMGISEIRLRDALLRMAGNSKLVAESVGMSNRAWEENTALQDEAALRYGTVQSQLTILRNKLTDVAISAGEELLPTVIDLVDMAEPLIDRLGEAARAFGSLDDETKQNIVTFGGLLIAGGPVLKLLAGVTTNAGKVSQALGKFGEKLFHAGKAATDAGKGTQILGLGLGGLKTLLVGGTIVAGVAALSYALYEWNEAQKESRSQTKVWGDDLDDATKQALTDVKTFSAEGAYDLKLFNEGLIESSDGVITAYSKVVDTIGEQGNKAITELDEMFTYLPEELQKTLQFSVNQRKTELNGLVEEAASGETRITEIMKTAAEERRSLTVSEMTEIEALQKRLLEIQAEIASENGETQDQIYEGMITKIGTLNQEQLRNLEKYYVERHTLRKENLDKEQTALDKALEDQYISEEKHTALMEDLQKRRRLQERDHMAHLIATWVAQGGAWEDYRDEAQQAGFNILDLENYINNEIAESRKGIIEITQDMTDEQVKAAQIWNDLIFNPITGEVNTNTEEVIAQAVNDEVKWNEMVFLLHDANIDTNIKQMIKDAMIENGTWNNLTFEEKQAILQTNAKTTAVEYLQAGGDWDKLTFEEKNAILETNTPEQLVQILQDFGLWERLDPKLQEFLAETNATEKATEAERAIGKYNQLHPTKHTLEVETNAWAAVTEYNNAMAQVGDRTVRINVSLNRTSMDNALGGIQAIGYAKGTNFHKGGLAILGDGGRREPFLEPSGRFGISPDKDTMYHLERGTKVWSSLEKFRQEASQKEILKPLVKRLPHFAEGTDRSFLNQPLSSTSNIEGDRYTFNFTLNGDVPRSKIKEITNMVQTEMKRINDNKKIAVGKGGMF